MIRGGGIIYNVKAGLMPLAVTTILSYLRHRIPAGQGISRENETGARNDHHNSAEDLCMGKASVCLCYQRSANGVSNKCRNTDDGKDRAVSDSDLPDVADLRYECRYQRYDRAGAETVEHGKDDDRSVRFGR